ncbi:MAG: GDSL-type esterase/lipase family protein [Acutalibacteraceae bacterium]|nr:GDSL-type esterase/lipase family protein [Acutalibacteraceae bacterium]
MKRTMKKLIAVLLAALMLASLGSVSAFAKTKSAAAGTGKVKTYNVVTSFGDSVAAGVSTSTYKAAHETKEAKTNYFIRVPGTYVDRVAKKVKAKKVYPLAQPGMRSEELRMLLCDDYKGDGHEAYVTNALNGYTSPGGKYKGKDPVGDYKKLRSLYQTAVKEADLITVGIGFNDVWFSILAAAVELSETGKVSDTPELTLFKKAEQLGSMGKALKQAEDALNTVMKITPYIPVITEAGIEAKARYFVNYRAIIERIYSLNPDVTIVSIGYHDALIPGEFDATNFLHYFAIFQPSFEAMNAYTRVRPTLYGEYIYVDMHGTETVLNSTETWDPHPTDAGHKYMAQQILKALPKA